MGFFQYLLGREKSCKSRFAQAMSELTAAVEAIGQPTHTCVVKTISIRKTADRPESRAVHS